MTKDAALAQRVEDAVTAQYALPGWELCNEMQFAADTQEILQNDERWLSERKRREALRKALSGLQ